MTPDEGKYQFNSSEDRLAVWRTALEMMNNGKIDVSNMVTHRFPFKEPKEAFDLVAGYHDGVMKAMIDF